MAQANKSIKPISIDHLQFDPQNPRLPSSIDGKDSQAVLSWLLKEGNLIELMAAIGEHDYFEGEPLLVVPVSGKDESFEVVEGNRRLAAVMLLQNPDLAVIRSKSVQQVVQEAKYKPRKIPSVIFETRDEILDFLGYRHITGIKPWSSLAKAKYLDQLKMRDPKLTFKDLAKSIGSRADYVAGLLTGLAIYGKIADNAFFGIKGLDEESISFAVLTTALNYSSIASFLGLESGRDPSLKGLKKKELSDLTSWLFEKNLEGKTRIGESRNLKLLSAVVENKNALKAFMITGVPLADAYLLTDEPINIFHTSILEARDRLQTAQSHIHQVSNPTESDGEILKDIQAIARDLRLLISQRLIDKEED